MKDVSAVQIQGKNLKMKIVAQQGCFPPPANYYL